MPTELAPTTDNPGALPPVPKLVLDTSTLIMAVRRPNSKHRWLRDAWHNRLITPLTSAETENEFERTLRKPELDIPSELIRDIARDYLDYCTKRIVAEPPLLVPLCRDPKDQPFLDLAHYAEADYLVTGDDDLLTLSDLSRVPIIDPDRLQSVLRHRT